MNSKIVRGAAVVALLVPLSWALQRDISGQIGRAHV